MTIDVSNLEVNLPADWGGKPRMGGCGYVLRFKDKTNGVFYAGKFLKGTPSDTAKTRFEREQLVMEFLSSQQGSSNFFLPLLQRVVDNSGNEGYLMPFCENGSLRDHLAGKSGTTDVQKALKLFYLIVRAVEIAHRHSIYHHDLKPDNILIYKGNCVLSDWGLAWIPNDNHLTDPKCCPGTPDYLDTHVKSDATKRNSPKGDLFSLARMLYLDFLHPSVFTKNGDHDIVAQFIYKWLTDSRWDHRCSSAANLLSFLDGYFSDPQSVASAIRKSLTPQAPRRPPNQIKNEDPMPLLLALTASMTLIGLTLITRKV